jgi:short-subunit dehydrogenase
LRHQQINNSIQYGTNLLESRTIIIGATGELGRALALVRAARGDDILLLGRARTRLETTAAQCRECGASRIELGYVDLLNVAAARAALQAYDEAVPTRCLIIASGLGDIRADGDLVEAAELVERLGTVNYLAPTVIAAEIAKRMTLRGNGQITLIGSAAGFHPLPFSIAYSASKAGLARFADALRIASAPHGVSVTLVSPGFIDTAAARMVPGPKPFALDVGEAAKRIVAATERGQAHLVTPWPFTLIRLLERALPRALSDRLLRSLAPKPGLPAG